MHCNILCDKNLRIIRINKSHTKIYHFAVLVGKQMQAYMYIPLHRFFQEYQDHL